MREREREREREHALACTVRMVLPPFGFVPYLLSNNKDRSLLRTKFLDFKLAPNVPRHHSLLTYHKTLQKTNTLRQIWSRISLESWGSRYHETQLQWSRSHKPVVPHTRVVIDSAFSEAIAPPTRPHMSLTSAGTKLLSSSVC